MRVKTEVKTDVLVMGAGLAGIMAAISAAEAGADVCIVSGADICSGSSFYPGTWGLGLIGPKGQDPRDGRDLADTILKVGEGMARKDLADTLAQGIPEGVQKLLDMGVELKEAENQGEKEFIPCFDHKERDWHGLVKDSARAAMGTYMKQLGIRFLPRTAILDCVKRDGRAAGAVAVSKSFGVGMIACKSLVIASGGLGGLFRYRLNTDDVTGIGHDLALRAGARLVNLEFMQMMPGFIKPAPKTIYNEKVFKYSNFYEPDTKNPIFGDWDDQTLSERMEIRSTHGPFTSRLPSGAVDVRLFEAFIRHPEGVAVSYKRELKGKQPEFIRTYFEWLWREKHLTVDDPVWIGIFAHASNGGIEIDANAYTGVPGLYACGEATGGMHGADRIGGLSTANGLVFGRIAGRKAAEDGGRETGMRLCDTEKAELHLVEGAAALKKEIQALNSRCAMVVRGGPALIRASERLRQIGEEIKKNRREFLPGDDPRLLYDTAGLTAALHISECMVNAMLLRRESRGPHFREDYPEKNEKYACTIQSYWKNCVFTEFVRPFS